MIRVISPFTQLNHPYHRTGININIKMSSKAAELLQVLNNQVKHAVADSNLTKEASPGKVADPALREEGSNRQQLIIKEGGEPRVLIGKVSPFSVKIRAEQSHEAPECLVDILSKQVGTQISTAISDMVEQVLKQRQKNTFESITGDEVNYIQAMFENSKKRNETNFNLITNLLARRSLKVEDQLEAGHLEVIPEKNIINKKQLEIISQLDVERLIKIKQGQLRSKVDLLHEKMANLQAIDNWKGPTPQEARVQEQIHKKYLENIDATSFSLDSEKTKIAKDYVRYMQQQRKLLEKRRKEREARYTELQKERQSDLNEAMQMKDLAKRQEILERIEKRRQKREQEEKELQAKQQDVHKFLSEFHRKNPIFKQKQKEFEERILRPEQRYRQEKLMQIRENRKSMSLNEIKMHEQKYLSKLQTERIKRQQQFKLILKSRQAEDMSHPYYKGEHHRRMDQLTKQQQKRDQALREASKLKSLRMKQYSEVIHSKHKPNIDQEKRQQLMNYIQADMMRKQKAKKVFKQVVDQSTQEVKLVPFYEPLPQRDYKSEGKKYFIQAKKNIKKKDQSLSEKIDNEENVKSSREKHSRIQLLRSQGEMQSKMKDIWQVRAKNLQEMAGSDIIDAKNFEYVKHNIQNLDKKAAEKEQLMKQISMPMEDHIKQKQMLDKYYLQSIKQKMKLLE